MPQGPFCSGHVWHGILNLGSPWARHAGSSKSIQIFKNQCLVSLFTPSLFHSVTFCIHSHNPYIHKLFLWARGQDNQWKFGEALKLAYTYTRKMTVTKTERDPIGRHPSPQVFQSCMGRVPQATYGGSAHGSNPDNFSIQERADSNRRHFLFFFVSLTSTLLQLHLRHYCLPFWCARRVHQLIPSCTEWTIKNMTFYFWL